MIDYTNSDGQAARFPSKSRCSAAAGAGLYVARVLCFGIVEEEEKKEEGPESHPDYV